MACCSLLCHLDYAYSNVSECLLKATDAAGIEFNLEPGRRAQGMIAYMQSDSCVRFIC